MSEQKGVATIDGKEYKAVINISKPKNDLKEIETTFREQIRKALMKYQGTANTTETRDNLKNDIDKIIFDFADGFKPKYKTKVTVGERDELIIDFEKVGE